MGERILHSASERMLICVPPRSGCKMSLAYWYFVGDRFRRINEFGLRDGSFVGETLTCFSIGRCMLCSLVILSKD